MAAILKTDLYSKLERLEHWKLSLRCSNANSFMFFKKIVFKKVLKSFRRVLKSKNSLKS
jgi:hypothetical protein